MPKKAVKNHRVIRAILTTIGALFLVWFLLPAFTNVKANIGNLTGIGVFTFLTLYGIFFVPVNRFLRKLWKKKAGKAAEIFLGLIFAAIFTLAIILYGCMLHAAVKQPLPNATLIVLGCKVHGRSPSLILQNRLTAALDYLNKNPDSLCIVSGAQGDGEAVTEASVMYRWFCDRGISPSRILLEEQATDTRDNLRYSIALMEQHPECSRTLAIATSDFHVYRALRVADSFGFEAGPVTAKTPWWLYPTYVVREMYGILENWFLQ